MIELHRLYFYYKEALLFDGIYSIELPEGYLSIFCYINHTSNYPTKGGHFFLEIELKTLFCSHLEQDLQKSYNDYNYNLKLSNLINE